MNLLLNLAPFLILGTMLWLLLRGRSNPKGAVSADGTPIENLIGLEYFDADETGYWARLPWVVGPFFGATFAAVAWLMPIPNTRYSPPITAALTLAIGAPFFGVLFPLMWRRLARLMTVRLYTGERSLIDPPPRDLLIRYQLVCAWTDGKAGAFGVLYLGSRGLLFMPHKRNPKKRRLPIAVTPIDAVDAELVAPPAGNALRRMLVPRPCKLMELTWPEGRALFMVPRPDHSLARLRDCLRELQSSAGSSKIGV